jgi:glycosyltransferase involved in cell wall biosynthesis
LKIVFTKVGSVLNVNGINFFIFELSNALIKAGHKVDVISAFEEESDGISIKDLFDVERFPTIRTFGRSRNYKSWMKESRREPLLWLSRGSLFLREIAPDMLIANGVVPIRSPTFKVLLYHDLEFRRSLYQKLYARVLIRAHTFDVIATTSTELAKRIPLDLGVKSGKIEVIPVCINTQKYVSLTQEKRERAILHVGTWRDKNLETTVRAFCTLAKIDPMMKLYVVGDLWSKPKQILSTVKREIATRIVCVGIVSKRELRELYSRVQVAVVPSIYKVPVISPTVLESLASGTPVVGGSTAISNDLLVDGYNGFRVYPTDFRTISERILSLTADIGLWNRMSTNAQSHAKKFDAASVARKYVTLYQSFRKAI